MGLVSKSFVLILIALFLTSLIVLAFTSVKADSIPTSVQLAISTGHIRIESPINRTYTSGFLTLNASFGGLGIGAVKHSLNYTLDGIAMGPMTIVPHYPDYLSFQVGFTASVDLPQLSKGQHVVTVYAEYSLENETRNDNSTAVFNISDTVPLNESTPPTISNFTVENKTYPSNKLSFNFDVDKAVTSTSYSLDNRNISISNWWDTPASTRTFNFSLKELTEGSHTLAAYVEDTFANFGASENVYFAVDTTAPNVSILSVENKTYDLGNVPLNFAVDESVSSIVFSLDGKENVSIPGNSTISGLSNGVHNVTVYAMDAVGNIGTSKTFTFTVILPFPVVPVAAVSVTIAVFVAAVLLIYFKKGMLGLVNKHS